MGIGLVGRKCGMTRVFDGEQSIPVSVILVEPNFITQIKSQDKDGYSALQITTGTRKANRVNKSLKGHLAKASVEAGRGFWEFRIHDVNKKIKLTKDEEVGFADMKLGQQLTVGMLEAGEIVDIAGISKGKGFAGVVKRHNFAMQDATHGNSLSHRAPGSIGQNQTPGRVFKGKKMAGHMGNERCTVKNLQIVKVDEKRNLLLVKGAIPGCPSNDVIVYVKK